MARSTRLVILIKNIYTLWGRKRFRYILSDESSIPVYSTSNGVTADQLFSLYATKPLGALYASWLEEEDRNRYSAT